MLDIKFVRANPELVKENIKKKFQDNKLVLVDEVIAIDEELRQIKKSRKEKIIIGVKNDLYFLLSY